jgi:(4-(4-[2-(gamma-L-glutamylamino)ethyl]phenoxymethyl)furan-2-yl)methanamine synthase
MTSPGAAVIGWAIGGAHVKAARWQRGELADAAQWPCPLWQGMQHLERALAAAAQRWPDLARQHHAVTMTGEMVDLFLHREDGVRRIAGLLAGLLPARRFFAGDAGWCPAERAAAMWRHIASANWLATASHAAKALAPAQGVLVDIGSATTDLVAFAQGRVLTTSRSDAQRLAQSELVYQGVVRTPLCAVAQRIGWRGEQLNVMNEFFATSADVYRPTGELDPAHDQHPSADDAAKDLPATHARLARMIGLDARDGSADEWLAFAHAWRQAQCAGLREQFARVCAAHRLGRGAVLVATGCGAFLVPELLPGGWRCLAYAQDVVRVGRPEVAAWAQVAAPAVAVAALRALEAA